MKRGYCRYSFTAPQNPSGALRARLVRDAFALEDGPESLVVFSNVSVPQCGITYVTGFSGSGKTLLLTMISADRPEARHLPAEIDPDATAIELIEGDLATAVHWLARFGLGEARLFVTPYRLLSDGQKYRLRLALMLRGNPQVVIVDEFLSQLDRLTAKIVAFNFQRECRRNGITAYLATAHDDLVDSLAPDHLIYLDFAGRATIKHPKHRRPAFVPEVAEVEVGAGSAADCAELVRFHYRAIDDSGVEWERAQIRVARFRGQTIGVAVYTPPFPSGLDVIPFFRALNAAVITCFRTIVHPAFRGAGMARSLEPIVLPGLRVITVLSAFEVYFPYHEGLGYLRSHDPMETKLAAQEELEQRLTALGAPALRLLRSKHTAEAFLATCPIADRRVILDLCEQIVIEQSVAYSEFLARLTRVEVASSDNLRQELLRFFEAVLTGHLPPARLLSRSLHFPLRGYYKDVR